eukprot:2924920-Alexandrium_andersonii.AAC.1
MMLILATSTAPPGNVAVDDGRVLQREEARDFQVLVIASEVPEALVPCMLGGVRPQIEAVVRRWEGPLGPVELPKLRRLRQ